VTGRHGVLITRQGQYALALLPRTTVQLSEHLAVSQAEHVQGDVLPGGLPLLIADFVLLSAGIRPPGLLVGEVMEP
jgi:hypothetical protein